MANTIKQKRGTTDPAASDLVVGELAINTTDGGVFTKTDGGTVIELGKASLNDDERYTFGNDNDLQIFHNSTNNNSVIKESGSGSLVLSGDNVAIKNAAGTENKAQFNTDASVILYHNNVEKIRTADDGVDVTGAVHLGDNAITDNNSGDLEITADNLSILNSAGSLTKAKFLAAGQAELYHSNSKKFETTSAGVTVTGDISLGDAYKIKLGADDDLQLFHESTINKIYSTQRLGLLAADVYLTNTASTITFANFGSTGCTLRSSGSKRLEVDSNGTEIVGNLEFVNSDDIVRFEINNDVQTKVKMYKSGEIEFFSEEINFYKHGTTTELLAKFTEDGPVTLFYDGTSRFITRSDGAQVNGTCTATEFSGSGASLTGVVKSDTTGITGASTVSNIVTISQSDYDAISSPDANTIYYVTS